MAQETEVLTVSRPRAPIVKMFRVIFTTLIDLYTNAQSTTHGTYNGISKTGDEERIEVSKKGISKEREGYWQEKCYSIPDIDNASSMRNT